jgi:hypothetical protein
MAIKKAETQSEIKIPALQQGGATLRIIGTTPLLQNRMANKVKQVLLVGGRRKTAAERQDIKHHPLQEFRDSAEILQSYPEGPTALGLRVTAIKGAMCSAALETAGVTKTSAQRLIFMPGDYVDLYGTPQLRMDVVRSADINKTPDVRSRAYLPQWGAEVDIRYIMPQLSQHSVGTLLANAGVLIGVGDGRQEKGKLSFGCFRVIGDEQDDEWDDLVKNHGRKQQLAALESPSYATPETKELIEFYESEIAKRSGETVVPMKSKKSNEAAA